MKPKHPATQKYFESGIFDGLTAFKELEQRIKSLPTEQERGDAFEVFAEAYLATQKITQAKEVWPETQLTPTLVKRFNLGRRKGVGVDGLYETTGGEWYAYQVKFRRSQNLTYNEVSPFYGITEAFDQRVLITNCNRLASQIDDRTNAFCIRGNDLARLERADFEAIIQWLKSAAVEIERKEPDPHQQEALDAILPALKNNDRVSAIMACGTGKTLVTLWAAEQYGCTTVLVLVPSLALIRQTLHEWLAETTWPRLAYLCVCSDPSVQKGSDDIVIRPSELDFPVSTDSSTVAEFLSKPSNGVKVVFSTYQSAPVVADGMNNDFFFDLGIFDEAHKTAGRQGKKNSYALDNDNLAIRKRLFVTATPRHYSPRKKTTEGDQAVLYSMDDPAVYGPLDKRYELSFAEAARRRIICDYKVIISAIGQEEVTNKLLRRGEVIVEGDSVRARQVANQLAIKNAIERYGIKKVFSFHGRVKSAASFTSGRSEGINSIIPDLPAFHVNGKMNASDRESIMQEFAAAPWGIVSNAKCLTEGVDVPAVDMVAFMSPKKSKVDIVQAAGRAMRRPRVNSDKTVGYVFIPLYVEQAKGESEEEAISRLGFEDLADVLNAMKEQDDVLADVFREMQERRGRTGGYDDSRLREKLEVMGELVALDSLQEAITTYALDRLGEGWDYYYGKLQAYKESQGDCLVPAKYDADKSFGHWANNQRGFYRNGKLRHDRIDRLNEIGFEWNVTQALWDKRFSELEAFYRENGHSDVPTQKNEENPQLGHWVAHMRQYRKRGELSEDKIARLDSLEFSWDSNEAHWNKMFRALAKAESVPSHWKETQRKNWRTGTLSEEHLRLLESIGFEFNPYPDQWSENLTKLERFYTEFEHCNVPKEWDRALSVWVLNQRTAKRLKKLSQERTDRLNEIGFDWRTLNAQKWDAMFELLAECKNRYGNLEVPPHLNGAAKLRTWIGEQQRMYRKGRLDNERCERLKKIGFKFDNE